MTALRNKPLNFWAFRSAYVMTVKALTHTHTPWHTLHFVIRVIEELD